MNLITVLLNMSRIIFIIFSVISISCETKHPKPPNIIFVLTDDQGYQDIGIYGAEGFETPHIDRLAREGVILTSYYASQPVCSASRASILTGCYANRVGIHMALGPGSQVGINQNEELLPELLREQGYATGIFGKWHLGDAPNFMPRRHGFDEFYGILYSNDMWPYHPTADFPELLLYQNEDPVRKLDEQSFLTDSITIKAIDFINKNKNNPFFLYIPHPQPHVPLFAHQDFIGSQPQGLYGDVIHEIDDSVGRIRKALEENNIDDNTIIIFTSDNGPWLSYGSHGGSKAIFREGKGTVWEGGVRVPSVVWYPKEIPANQQIHASAMAIDWLPTILDFTGGRSPKLKIDGNSMKNLLTRESNKATSDNFFFYYGRGQLQAIRHKDWKLYYPHTYISIGEKQTTDDGIPIAYDYISMKEIELYNLETDPQEAQNVAETEPEVVERINQIADSIRWVLGDELLGIKGLENRESGRITQ